MKKDIKAQYQERFRTILNPLAERLETYLTDLMKPCSRVDRVKARAKSVDRFVAKATKREGRKAKYSHPLTSTVRGLALNLSHTVQATSEEKEFPGGLVDGTTF